jgi:hypothetical protein
MYFVQLNRDGLGYDVVFNGKVIYNAGTFDKAHAECDRIRASVSEQKAAAEFKKGVALGRSAYSIAQ